ncbi:MAG: 16S rRNA (guanine(527)-N(7))-methyltransferase RsmG [Lachnospiraceae bacterium]|nr:16S rRNA (guanine(527)-N(7))-methyltransferase RsmG [Lachnospiraceae bacterium]
MDRDISIFTKGLRELNIELDDSKIKQFIDFYEMLVEKNKVMNLTAITEYDEVVVKHFLDSISIGKYVDFKEGQTIIDVGTGAGFPGIPLKIAFPMINATLLDSLNKRIKFLEEVRDALELDKLNMIHGRAEDYGQDTNYREKYDYCVSRAVANMSTLAEYCLPFVKVGGYFVSYKSGNIEEELNNAKSALKILGAKVEKVESFILPDSDISRSLVFIKKIEPMKKKYPRKAGLPSKEPLA